MIPVCNITTTIQQPQKQTFGELQGAPAGHPSHSVLMSLIKIFCDVKFIGMEPSCGAPTGFDTKFTLKAVCPEDQKVNEMGKKILFGKGVEDVHQNDPYCLKGNITDPQLFEMMQNRVLVALNYDVPLIENTYKIIWKVNGQEV